jgi:hypothetical protein
MKRMLYVLALLGMVPPAAPAAEGATQEWSAYVNGLAPLGEQMANQLTDPNDPQLRQELYRLMYTELAKSYFALAYQDPEHPDFWPMFNSGFNDALPNADTVYYGTAIEGNGVYKLSGFRGTVHLAHVQIGNGEFAIYGRGKFGPTLANHDLDHDVHLGKDGAFAVVVSAERPAGYKGDWWKLDATANYLFVRQISYDWLHEVDGRYAIERLDRPSIKPRESAVELSAKMAQMSAYVANWTQFELSWVEKFGHERQLGLVNKVGLQDFSKLVGMAGQIYINGLFDIAPDEALVLETEVPKQCRYWNFQLFDELNSALDFSNRQTSINAFSARLDKDGRFRAVISAQDPGVPNWLDTAGHQRGHVYGRWTQCSSNPEPVITKVKVADVRNHLPADTPTVTAEARDAAIRLRRKGAQLRRRW